MRVSRVPSFLTCALAAAAFGTGALLLAPRQADAQAARAQAQRADDRHWQELADQAEALLAKGDLPNAERAGRQLVDEGKKVFGDGHANVAEHLFPFVDQL